MDQQLEQVGVDIQKIVYKKAMLHACKYSTEDVIGILIGQINDTHVNIVDAYPLFHSRVSLNTLEVSLDIISSELQSDRKIIGVYEARANARGIMSEIAKEMLHNINQKQAIVLRISQVEVDDAPILNAKIVSLNENVKYVINSSSTLEWWVIQDCLKAGLHWKIIDFDAHFENVQLNFRNQYLE
ncbi:unnamed protein product (macronuclear) [Paramecium tetraurelia]|uniref:MPN domain-containing protein n=1 Tax=Paramecium tetraurelia TaxID=5888 RepID=A0CVM0_PARTE|nr:uncharacterized protein GSPATT00011005001 [Paramecium tetraurelia]CAK74837.1 unnamed protein product [Paramecium tetraurelia]|eukprot:XP_001442234.1 hypothetical protein (macronuclear) [Paramecium tetraurelia strain d4-2]